MNFSSDLAHETGCKFADRVSLTDIWQIWQVWQEYIALSSKTEDFH